MGIGIIIGALVSATGGLIVGTGNTGETGIGIATGAVVNGDAAGAVIGASVGVIIAGEPITGTEVVESTGAAAGAPVGSTGASTGDSVCGISTGAVVSKHSGGGLSLKSQMPACRSYIDWIQVQAILSLVCASIRRQISPFTKRTLIHASKPLTRAYTAGTPGWAQESPKETTPTWTLSCVKSGPPESP